MPLNIITFAAQNGPLQLSQLDANFAAIAAMLDQRNTYTPTWTTSSGTPPSIGDGSITGEYCRNGNFVYVRINVLFGAASTFGSGFAWQFSLPFAYAGTLVSLGSARYSIAAGNPWVLAWPFLSVNNTGNISVQNVNGSITSATGAWGNGGQVQASFGLEIAQ